jgi:hypothetical protein
MTKDSYLVSQEREEWETIIKKAVWLEKSERDILTEIFDSFYVNPLGRDQKIKLALLLCSILYAEKTFRINGRKFSLIIEKFLTKLRLHKYFCSTLGIWNFNVCHAHAFGYSKKKFKQLLEDKKHSTHIVMRYLIENVGLHKSPEYILAEYNHNIMATSVAALQRTLNLFVQKEDYLEEDGLLGSRTCQVFKKYADKFPGFFSLEQLDEPMVLKTLEYFSQDYGCRVEPFVPKVVFKRDMHYFLYLLKRGLKNYSELGKLTHIFKHHIDVPAYVEWGMTAYTLLKGNENAG